MKNLDKEFDKKFTEVNLMKDGSKVRHLKMIHTAKEIKAFIRQREKELLKEVERIDSKAFARLLIIITELAHRQKDHEAVKIATDILKKRAELLKELSNE